MGAMARTADKASSPPMKHPDPAQAGTTPVTSGKTRPRPRANSRPLVPKSTAPPHACMHPPPPEESDLHP